MVLSFHPHLIPASEGRGLEGRSGGNTLTPTRA
jgi:hypothetical protein